MNVYSHVPMLLKTVLFVWVLRLKKSKAKILERVFQSSGKISDVIANLLKIFTAYICIDICIGAYMHRYIGTVYAYILIILPLPHTNKNVD